jgi:CheY-like chemotaxis protein
LPSIPALSGRPIRILVVEDEESVRRVLVQILLRAGHEVVDLASARRALDLLVSTPFDLLCTDLSMPEMSGWDLIAQARAICPELQTILITGWGEQIDAEDACTRGADAVISKPFNTAHLRQLIAALQQRGLRGGDHVLMTTVAE